LGKSAYIEKFSNFRGVHCEFLNIGGRIENHHKLKGGNPYFSQIFINFYSFFTSFFNHRVFQVVIFLTTIFFNDHIFQQLYLSTIIFFPQSYFLNINRIISSLILNNLNLNFSFKFHSQFDNEIDAIHFIRN
jgi:hypothetical protein